MTTTAAPLPAAPQGVRGRTPGQGDAPTADAILTAKMGELLAEMPRRGNVMGHPAFVGWNKLFRARKCVRQVEGQES